MLPLPCSTFLFPLPSGHSHLISASTSLFQLLASLPCSTSMLPLPCSYSLAPTSSPQFHFLAPLPRSTFFRPVVQLMCFFHLNLHSFCSTYLHGIMMNEQQNLSTAFNLLFLPACLPVCLSVCPSVTPAYEKHSTYACTYITYSIYSIRSTYITSLASSR